MCQTDQTNPAITSASPRMRGNWVKRAEQNPTLVTHGGRLQTVGASQQGRGQGLLGSKLGRRREFALTQNRRSQDTLCAR